MVHLDHVLLHQARRLINGANVHRVKEMIFAYEQAVDLHNRKWGRHRKYQQECETQLRRFVMEHWLSQLDDRSRTARQHAQEWSSRSRQLVEWSDHIEERYQRWKKRRTRR